METKNNINLTFNNMIEKIGDMTVNNIWNVSPDGKNKILNLKLLTQTLASNILNLSRLEIKMGSDDESKIITFLNNLSIATENFCSFLDYDGDGIVELITRNDKNEIIIGDDIRAMVEDGNQITSAFKRGGDVPTIIIETIGSMAIYFTNTNVSNTRADFISFKIACDNAHASMMQLKTLDYDSFFKENIDEFMRFVIIMCILIIPVIELANNRIAVINNPMNNDKLTELAIITKEDIKNIVKHTYGLNIEFILISVDTLVNTFTKIVQTHASGKGFTSFVRKTFCCVTGK
jgi:hypothetical protein